MSPALALIADALHHSRLTREALSYMSTNDARESGFFPCAAAADRFESDDDLIAGMLANDPAAWREFQVRYDRLIMRCITKVTRRFASMVSQDDVREVFVGRGRAHVERQAIEQGKGEPQSREYRTCPPRDQTTLQPPPLNQGIRC